MKFVPFTKCYEDNQIKEDETGRACSVAASCIHSNEPSGSIKDGEFLDLFNDC
jgi:hypothetical protein